jgi:arylsulfatase A-like enzyme
MHNDWTAREFHLPEELHNTNWTIHEAQRFLDRRDPTRPFCMVVSFIASHPPLVPPRFYLERYLRTGVEEPALGEWASPPPNGGTGAGVSSREVVLEGERLLSARAGYYALINHLDDQIRRLMNGILGGVNLRETAIVYAADHGEMLGDHYKWAKSLPYQGAVRVPMLIRAPQSSGCPAGRMCEEPVCLEDLMPTLLDLAEVPVPASVEGRSLMPLLRGEAGTGWRSHVHIECSPTFHAVTDGREKYAWFVEDGREQFFRLEEDPYELENLAGKPDAREDVARWRRVLIKELKDRPEGFVRDGELVAGVDYPAHS